MSKRATIAVVDDDKAVRDSLHDFLVAAGHPVRVYPSASKFLEDVLPPGSCLITDVRMPGMDGLELQNEIARRGIDVSIIFITGHADVQMAVRALLAGASDFIEKPFASELVLASIQRAIESKRDIRKQTEAAASAQALIASLTPREHVVLEKVASGLANKVTAYELGLSPRTIEIHRANIMKKLHAKSLSQLVRTVIAAQ